MHPSVRPQPTTPATRSSLIQFCIETTQPPGARYGRIIIVAHSVSYDFTETNAMSIGFCLASDCTSVRCMALTFTVRRSASVMPYSSMPCVRIRQSRADIAANRSSPNHRNPLAHRFLTVHMSSQGAERRSKLHQRGTPMGIASSLRSSQ